MSERAIARRYAGALFDVAQKAGMADRAGEELSAIGQLVAGHAELRKVLETPAIPPSVKKDIITRTLAAAGGVSAEVMRLMAMLAERDRLALLRDIEAAYVDRLLEARKIVPAEVVTAVPLTDVTRSALESALGSATGSQVMLSERVDPGIMGGVVARVGSLVFDSSVARHLERLKQRLTAQA